MVHPWRCTNSLEKGLLETLEDEGDKGDSTETKKDSYKNGVFPIPDRINNKG